MEELTITANGGKHIKKPNSTPIVTFKLEFVPINVEPVNMPEPPYTIDSNGEFIYYFQTTDESYDITYASFWMLGADYEYTIENNIGILRVYNPQKDLEIIINNTWIENGYSKYSFNDQVLTIAAIDQEHNAIKAEDYAEFREIPEIEIYHGIIEIGEDAFQNINQGMDKLNKISFTNSITTIGENAFSTCSDLAYVDFYGTQEEWNNIVIEDGNNYLINAEITFYEYLPIQP